MVFYDYEVFKEDWLVVHIEPETETYTIIVNDKDKLEEFCENHKYDIWVGCNNQHYDQYIKKAVLCELDPKEVNDWIIKENRQGWEYSSLFRKWNFIEYDVMTRLDRGLKTWEGFMGNTIKETSVPFDINRKLTDEEIQDVIKYCIHDVEQTIEVFVNRIDDFNAQMGLIAMFPEILSTWDLGRTKAQISAKILECEYTKRDDEFDLFVLPCIDIKKYTEAIDFFMGFEGADSSDADDIYKQKHKMMISGLEHTLGWGGIHAGKEKYRNFGFSQKRQIWHVDVASFYPRLMIFHNLLTRNCKKPEKFRQIYDWRIDLKHQGKKKEQAPLKIVINGTFGISKSPTSAAYDPRNANLICLNGQLMLIDLIEHLEVIEGFELIQSNTDGLIVSLPDTDEAFEQMDEICAEWEHRCNMELEFDEIKALWGQKDVNNYVFEFANGKLERKGAYVKELSALDYDLPIVNKAVVDYLTKQIPVEDTILPCDDLKEFQMVKKISGKYKYILHGDEKLSEKCIRIFASKRDSDSGLTKVHSETGRPAKVENTPEHCFLWNDSVNDVRCPRKLDKSWYVDLAKKRLGDYGVM